jgi:hypothetical protein
MGAAAGDWEERTGRMLDIVIDGLRKQSVG